MKILVRQLLDKNRRSLPSSHCFWVLSKPLPLPATLIFCLFLGACASSGIRINSNPEGAELSTLQGESLGKTPLTLDQDQKSKIDVNGLASFRLSHAGHIPRLVLLDASRTREVTVELPRASDDTFRSEFSKDFTQDINSMLREAFAVQRLIAEGKRVEAENALNTFIQKFPNAAFGHFMMAHLALAKANSAEAQTHLLRARALDPNDPAIEQSLKLLQTRSAGGSSP